MRIEILHNTTPAPEGRLAIFWRIGDDPLVQPGDTLERVGELNIPDQNILDAAERVFEAGNSPADIPLVTQYRSWKVRSLSAGDVVIVHRNGRVFGLACERQGWTEVDLSTLTITRARLTHEQGIATAVAIGAEFNVAWHELRSFASHHLQEWHPDLEEVGSSDVSIHLSYLGNHEPELLREESERLRDRDALITKSMERSGKTYEETLAGFRALLAPRTD